MEFGFQAFEPEEMMLLEFENKRTVESLPNKWSPMMVAAVQMLQPPFDLENSFHQLAYRQLGAASLVRRVLLVRA